MGVPPPSDQGPDPSFRTYHRTWIWRKPVLAAATLTLGAVYAFLRWRPVRVEVRGRSMAPTLESGDWVLAVAPGRLRPVGAPREQTAAPAAEDPVAPLAARCDGVPGPPVRVARAVETAEQ